jgi:SAM-dependent methyltransferase
MPLIRDVMPGDAMYAYAPELYWEAGERALALCRDALGGREPQRVLDFACGAGRVLRHFKAAWPEAELTACDTWRPGLAWSVETFGALRQPGNMDPSLVELHGLFDLIWSGSLLTHVDETFWRKTLALWKGALGGALVFTAHGPSVAERVRRGELDFTPEQREAVLASYDRTGFGFAPSYSEQFNFGDCLSSPEWVRARLAEAGLSVTFYHEDAWLGQDVVAAIGRVEGSELGAGLDAGKSVSGRRADLPRRA